MKTAVAILTAILVLLSFRHASASCRVTPRDIIENERETKEALSAVNSSRNTLTAWLQGYLDEDEAEKEISEIRAKARGIIKAGPGLPERIRDRKLRGAEMIDRSLRSTAEYVRRGDPLNRRALERFLSAQTRELYRFVSHSADTGRIMASSVDLDGEDPVVSDYVLWKRAESKPAEKALALSLETELAVIDAAFSENRAAAAERLNTLARRSQEICDETAALECPESMATLKKTALENQSEFTNLLSRLASFLSGEGEGIEEIMKSHRERVEEAKAKADAFLENLKIF